MTTTSSSLIVIIPLFFVLIFLFVDVGHSFSTTTRNKRLGTTSILRSYKQNIRKNDIVVRSSVLTKGRSIGIRPSFFSTLKPSPSASVTKTRAATTSAEEAATLLREQKSTTIPSNSTTTTTVAGGVPTTWDCTDDAECIEVDACNDNECRTSLDVRIHNTWYDLSGWRKSHPGGSHWIDWYDGRDATDVMDAFHTKYGRELYKKLPKSKENVVKQLKAITPNDTSTQLAFRKLRDELENEGWWERDYTADFIQLSIWGSLVLGAAITASNPITMPVSTVLLALSMTAAGWLGHDYVHGVDTFCTKYMRNFAAVAAGLAPTWWSDKHNKHHALTNEQGVDEDIATDPFLYTWVPNPVDDSPIRRIQHYIFWIPFSFLFVLWRYDSIKVGLDAIEQKRPNAKDEFIGLMIHYVVLLSVFPISVWLPAIFISGLLSAIIVTPTHQSERMFSSYQSDWVTAQFESTRNAVTTNPFSEWIWGGMQYQLEHHLFPSMPRHNYPKLRQRLMNFAITNNIPGGYRESNEFDILRMNWELYKNVAEAGEPIPNAPLTRGRSDQLAAISQTNSPATGAGFSTR